MRLSLILFLLALLNSSCASKAVVTDFDGKWEMRDAGPGTTPKACLSEDDVMKLRTVLIRCQTGTQ